MRVLFGTFLLILAAVMAINRAEAIANPDNNLRLIRNIVYVDRGDVQLTADVYVPHGKGPFPGFVQLEV